VEPLRAAIARRFADSRARLVGERVHAEVEVDGVWYGARLELGPEPHVAVALPCTDGFELTLRWNDRWAADDSPQPATFDDSFLVETNDRTLAGVWLDHEARWALLSSRYVAGTHAERKTAVLIRDGGWLHEVSNDEVSARRAGPASADRMADMLHASLALASRPVRWAHAFERLARAVGGTSAARIEIGGKPALRVRRDMLDVLVHVVRRLGPGDPGRLRTIVSAHRRGSSGETLSLIADGLPRAAWPPPPDRRGAALPIDARAAHLLDLARPSTTTVRPHDVEIAFDGALADPERLGAAIELASHWAANKPIAGPYR
jgi:hypothetical protein